MLPVELLSALKAYAQNQPSLSAGLTGTAGPGLTPPLQEGQQMPALVLAQVSEGVFNVRIAGQLIQLNLPSTTQTGETVQLQVVSLQPRLTFGLVSNSAAQASASPSQLSDAARLLSSLQQSQPQTGKALIQGAGGTPLMVSEGLPSPQELAQALKQTIANSGLFYESHQAQWVGGERTTAQLLQEPQNQWTPGQASTTTVASAAMNVLLDAPLSTLASGTSLGSTPVATGNAGTLATTAGTSANSGAATAAAAIGPAPVQTAVGAVPASASAKMALYSQTTALGVASTQASSLGALQGSTATAAATSPATSSGVGAGVNPPGVGQGNAVTASIPSHLQPLVQQQLTALETGRVFWQGPVFPGQNMDWEIWQEEQGNTPAGTPASPKTWNTALRLNLPHLGVVEARMQFAGAGMNLLIQTAVPGTLNVLSQSSADLRGALLNAGIPVAQLRVVQQST